MAIKLYPHLPTQETKDKRAAFTDCYASPEMMMGRMAGER
jgi:hypothetical protein